MTYFLVLLKHRYTLRALYSMMGFVFFCAIPAFSQNSPVSLAETPSDTAYFDLDRDLAEQLMPFDSIYQAALRYSPTVRYQGAMVDSRLEAFRFTKVHVLDGIYPFVNYAQGNQSLTATGTTPTEGLQLSNGYRWGINLQVPLSEVFGRRARTHEARANYRAAVAQKDVEALTLKRDLIKVYQNLLTAQRILKVRIRDEQVALTAYRVAEVEVQQGKANPTHLAQISSIYAITKSYAERERGDFLINFYDLEALVGLPVQALKIKQIK